jgi:hypothetical protein
MLSKLPALCFRLQICRTPGDGRPCTRPVFARERPWLAGWWRRQCFLVPNRPRVVARLAALMQASRGNSEPRLGRPAGFLRRQEPAAHFSASGGDVPSLMAAADRPRCKTLLEGSRQAAERLSLRCSNGTPPRAHRAFYKPSAKATKLSPPRMTWACSQPENAKRK